jgi:predicted secreted acid phosphatase
MTKEIGFGFIPKLWDEWLLKGIAEALPQTKRFYDYLISKNINVVFITGRHKNVWAATHRNLIEKGFVKFDTLIVRQTNESKIPAAEYKSHQREELVKDGYDIIACIGDHWSDLTGGNTGYKIKLPNYLYLLD